MTMLDLFLEFWVALNLAPLLHFGAVSIFGRDP
jgi:hypothetical protein